MAKIRLGVITDEVSQDVHEALARARRAQLDYIDLRDVGGQNIAKLDGKRCQHCRGPYTNLNYRS